MGRTYRRGESFLLARHGRRSAVRPQLRSGCAVFVLAIWAITTIRRAGTRVETKKADDGDCLKRTIPFQAQPDLLHVLGPGRSCDGL
jgi:hypothetical protein